MRTSFLYTAFFTLYLNVVCGQTRIVIDGPSRIDTANRPLVLVDSFKTDLNHLVLDPGKIESVNILKDTMAISKFGKDGKSGVILIHPKATAKFFRVQQILDDYKITEADRKLRICINNTLMRYPQLILIESSEIESVEITTERKWINTEDANSGERFINIITRTKSQNRL